MYGFVAESGYVVEALELLSPRQQDLWHAN